MDVNKGLPNVKTIEVKPLMEGQPEGNNFTLYGIVASLQETEYGYVSANEMASIAYDANEYGLGRSATKETLGLSKNLQVEQDKDFKPCTLAEIKDVELQKFLSRLYDKDLLYNPIKYLLGVFYAHEFKEKMDA